MRHLPFLLALITPIYLNAQSTLIEYNYLNETYRFYKIDKNGDTSLIKRPFGYNEIPTKIVIKDLNTFYYGVNFTVESRKDEPVGGQQGMQDLSESFTQGAAAFGMLIDEVQGNEIYQSLWKDGQFQGLEGLKAALGAGADEFTEQRKEIEVKGSKLEKTQELIAEESNNIKDALNELLVLELVVDQLQKLQKNKDISLEEMRTRAHSLITKVLDEPTLEQVVVKWQENTDELVSAYNSYKTAYARYNSQKNVLLSSIDEVRSDAGNAPFGAELDDFRAEVNAKAGEVDLNIEVLEIVMAEFNSEKIKQDYVSAFEAYDKIVNADFEFEYSVNNRLDITTVTMEFVELSDSTEEGKEERVLKTKVIDIPAKGGLRINSSAGMSFLRFAAGHYSYNSDNGVVNKVSGDAFLPSLTTMFHFYRQSVNPIAIGGSFGISVPTQGEKDFIYMLGSSLIVGKMERVIINFGAFGGKIERLDGVAVGDKIADGVIVPTKRVFDFGFYGGVSFNINSLF